VRFPSRVKYFSLLHKSIPALLLIQPPIQWEPGGSFPRGQWPWRETWRFASIPRTVALIILSTLMIEAICFSKSLVLTRATRRHIPENCSLLGSVSFFRRREGGTSVGSVRKSEPQASLNERGKQIPLPKQCVSSYLEFRATDKIHTPNDSF
jgi:hypothetical protein